MTAKHYRVSTLPADHPLPGVERRRVVGEQAMLSIITLERGTRVRLHAHDNEQFACILSGELRFTLGEGAERRTLSALAGDVIHLPGGVPHGVVALDRSRVLDVFAPPSAGTGLDTKT